MQTKTKKEIREIQKQIDAELQDSLCIDPGEILDWKPFRHFLEWSEPFEPIDNKVFTILSLRLEQLGIDVAEDEFWELRDYLNLYFCLEVKSKYTFKQIAKLPKKKLLDALTELRKHSD